jgi:hypothetical protein
MHIRRLFTLLCIDFVTISSFYVVLFFYYQLYIHIQTLIINLFLKAAWFLRGKLENISFLLISYEFIGIFYKKLIYVCFRF